MKTKEEIKSILQNYLESVYCDTCSHRENYDICDECSRKSMMWGISEKAAGEIADKIIG